MTDKEWYMLFLRMVRNLTATGMSMSTAFRIAAKLLSKEDSNVTKT